MAAQKTKYKGTLFKSKAEAAFAKALDGIGVKWDYEKDKFKWMPPPPRKRTYTSDWTIKRPCDGHKIIIETKGRLTAADRQKMLAVQRDNPKADIRFIFYSPNNKLSKTSKTKYWEWAEKNGFKWAKFSTTCPFPPEWLKPGG